MLKSFRSRSEVLVHRADDFVGKSLGLLFNFLQLLGCVLAEFVLCFANLLSNGFFGRFENLFRLLTSLLQSLRAEVLA